MSPARTAPGRLLTQVAGERQTGVLVVGGHAVHLHDGAVVYAESPAAPGVGELLTASGRLAGRTWQAALDAGSPGGRVGRLLLEQGHLTQGELELCVLGAIYDAAYFALAPGGSDGGPEPEFRAGRTHWLGTVVRVEAAAVTRESKRRARLLDDIFPHPEVDTAPVTPVPRAPTERVTLTRLQWELLVNADGQRTPADLAQLIGRAGYAIVQELRRLAAMGLIVPPKARAKESSEQVRLPRARGSAAPPPEVHVHSPPAAAPASTSVAAPAPAPVSVEPAYEAEPAPTGTVYRPPRLARRKPGAKLPKDLAGEPPPEPPGTDEVLLKRIRTALRALR